MIFSRYEILSSFYDKFNSEVDYSKWADFLDRIFNEYSPIKPKLLLDLCCGTGNITLELANKGYEMIGIDLSEEMLGEAQRKTSEQNKKILYIKQDMRKIDLYGTVDGCVCSLDGINYLSSVKELEETFSGLNKFLNDGAIFVFDVNTPYKFKNIYGNNAYVFEDEDVFCTWQNFYNEKTGKCDFDLTFFTQNKDGSYDRYEERQTERCFCDRTIRKTLEKCGFSIKKVYGDIDFSEQKETNEKWHYVCSANNKNK